MQWFRFYSGALDDPKVQRLTGDLFKVWINLLCLANESEERGILPSNDDIAFRLRLDDQKTADALRGLIRAGLLDQDEDGALHIHGWEARQKKSDDVTARVQKHRDKDNNPGTLPKRSSNALEKKREEERREEKRREDERTTATDKPSPAAPDTTPTVRAVPKPPRGPAGRVTALFTERFWPAWPKKVAKQEAFSAFAKLDPSAEDVEHMVAAIPVHEAALNWPRENYRYCPNASTWLNQRRWEDEVQLRAPPVRPVSEKTLRSIDALRSTRGMG